MSVLELLTAPEAAVIARRHPVTVRKALETGELHGHQRTERGRWRIQAGCLESWAIGEPCEHRRAVTERRHLRAVGGQR